jgi:poly(3-hydroxybutyrate) depolymerase
MLYQLYETQRALVEPFADFAQATAKLYSNPMLPSASCRTRSAWWRPSICSTAWQDYEKPEFDIRSVKVNGVDVTIRERVEIDKPFCELRRFKRFSDDPTTLDTLLEQPPC